MTELNVHPFSQFFSRNLFISVCNGGNPNESKYSPLLFFVKTIATQCVPGSSDLSVFIISPQGKKVIFSVIYLLEIHQ